MHSDIQIFGPTFSTFVRTVMLCCDEKGFSYHVGLSWDGLDVGFKSAAHQALHPWGRVPVIKHQGQTLYETHLFCDTLIRFVMAGRCSLQTLPSGHRWTSGAAC